MSKRIIDTPNTGNPTNFPPLVSIREKGNYVTGTVVEKGITVNGNPTVTLTLKDLEGSTQKSVSKGVYQEVDVAVGDLVCVVGSSKQLKEKLPLLNLKDLVTITFKGKKSIKAGRSMNEFEVSVEEN
jgi:hypothetical protein